jgi:hypothetical protein
VISKEFRFEPPPPSDLHDCTRIDRCHKLSGISLTKLQPSRRRQPAAMFGVVFPDHTFPLDATAFAQVAPTSWLLDFSTLSLPSTPRSAVVFLLPPAAAALPPGKAVAVYYQAAANRPFAFLGALGPTRPSATFRLPEAGDEPEPPAPEEQRAERVALRVGENLFNFMQSFCAADGGKLIVPTDIMDRWFRKFQERAKKDPSYLKSFDF